MAVTFGTELHFCCDLHALLKVKCQIGTFLEHLVDGTEKGKFCVEDRAVHKKGEDI